MKELFYATWHKVLIFLMAADHLWRRVVDWEDDWQKSKALFGRRKEDKMANPIADIQLALTILADVRTALPILAKGIQDLKQAFADKADPTKAANDLEAVLSDLEPLLNQVMALVPQGTPTPTPVVPPATPPAVAK